MSSIPRKIHLGARDQVQAGGGGTDDAVARPLEDVEAEFQLELPDLLADTGLGRVERIGSGRYVISLAMYTSRTYFSWRSCIFDSFWRRRGMLRQPVVKRA